MPTKRPLYWIYFAAWTALLAFALPAAPAFADTHNEMDAPWPHWRGHAQNGSSTETGLPDSWEMNGKNHLWTADIVLRSTPVVMNGRVYVIGRTGMDISEQERVACFDAKTGDLVWEDTFNIYLTTIPFTRGGWANPAGDPETGNIYTHGVGGVFRAYDKDGNILWSKSLTELYGRISGYGGRTNTPVIVDDLVVLSYLNSSWGGQIPRHRFWAFDKKTGSLAWITTLPNPPYDTTYSVPVVADINGQRLIVTGGADGSIYALQASTGKIVWSFALSKRGINASVVVDGDKVYAAHSEENIGSSEMGSVVCIDGTGEGDITQSGALWRRDGFSAGYASLAVHNGVVYAVENASNLIAMDGETGDPLWTHSLGTVGKGSPVIADGKIYAPEVNGLIHILKLTENGVETLDVDKLLLGDRPAEIYGSPAVGYRRVYIPTETGLYCIGTDADASTKVSSPPMLGPRPESADEKVAQLQIRPAEVLLKPGESVQFTAYAFAANGRLIGAKEVIWSVTGAQGSVNYAGMFQTHSAAAASAGIVTAEEVAPPGLDRPLRSPSDFQRAIGYAVSLLRRKAGSPDAELVKGFVESVDENALTLEDRNGQLISTNMKAVIGGKFDGMQAVGRIRISPNLPYYEDLTDVADGQAPGFWIGSAGKFKTIERGGERVLHKGRVARGLDRSYVYIGAPDASGYTVQADLMGTRPRRSMPDMGLIANRYVLTLEGNHQALHIFSWASDLRMAKQVPFKWEPDVWYRMELRVDIEDGEAVVRGKVWKRVNPKPDAWTIEAVDPYPNLEGSAGIYGFSYADIYYDNITVRKSE
ncbi:MAG: PQQ-binding-like beta-propeller repeat protein [Candidatus Poribacteria bacterium]|nr:PQQ-binding-like beta-propeller repeat protein [Candidatus Poribacteria bacterium]